MLKGRLRQNEYMSADLPLEIYQIKHNPARLCYNWTGIQASCSTMRGDTMPSLEERVQTLEQANAELKQKIELHTMP